MVGVPSFSGLPIAAEATTLLAAIMTSSLHCVKRGWNNQQNESSPLTTTRSTQETEFAKLSRALKQAFDATDEVSPRHPAAEVLKAVNATRLAAELKGQEQWNATCYTRTTLIHEDNYVVMLLCWSPGVSSPVHAHSDANTRVQSNCFMRILDGSLTETLYEPSSIINDGASVAALDGHETTLATGGFTYINDQIGLHKVGNASSTERAVSLHVYAPGWKLVNTYDEQPVSAMDVETDAGGAPIDVDGWGD